MIKKIGSILLTILMIWAVVLLLATDSRAGKSAQSAETKPSVNQNNTYREPWTPFLPSGTTEQTGPGETEPMHSAPSVDELGPSVPENTALPLVRQILEGEELAKTARSHWVWYPELNYHEDTTGTALTSNSWALALIAAERKMNPIAAFWVLRREGLYTKTEDDSGVLSAGAFSVPLQGVLGYEYTDEGARQLLTDLLDLSAGLEDGLNIESGLLGASEAVDEGQVALARKTGCYYGYFISGGERSTHILCFYLRGDKKGEWITDVEFQLLNLRSAQGSEEALALLDRRGDTQAAALIAAAELLMTGQTQAGQGLIPFTRQVGSFTATIERFCITGDGESGDLINYRLRKA